MARRTSRSSWCGGAAGLRNLILCDGARSVELDHVVRVRSEIVVLETKTLGGVISDTLDDALWTQWKRRAGEIEVRSLVNPVLQNRAHVAVDWSFRPRASASPASGDGRGPRGPRPVAHPKAAISASAAWQRCYVHFLRNALDYVPRRVDDNCWNNRFRRTAFIEKAPTQGRLVPRQRAFASCGWGCSSCPPGGPSRAD